VVATGGLGSPLTLYLAAASLGTIGIVDFDAGSLQQYQRRSMNRT
jgi:molybdopterin/thiamine biosynthesis adenylyltransferase